MPASSSKGKKWSLIILRTLIKMAGVKKVMDVGPGIGAYSVLVKSPETKTTAVEIWGPYVKKYGLEERYDKVIVSDIRYLDLEQLGKFDAVILGDILEHMSKEDAVKTVNRLREKARFILISIPVKHCPQGEEEGNPFEVHVKDDWSDGEVKESFAGIRVAFIQEGIGVYIIAEHPLDIQVLNQAAEFAYKNMENDDFKDILQS